MNLSAHFTVEEATRSDTAIRLSIDNTPSADELQAMKVAAEGMERVRALLGVPITVTSWLRVPKLDRAIGGSGSERGHSSGYCVDFKVPDFGSPLDVCRKVVDAGIKFDQLIQEGTWTHISFHPAMRQQVLTAHFHEGWQTTYTAGLL